MANQHKAQAFTEQSFAKSDINIHIHAEAPARRLAIFVHGFNGSPYETWRNFLAEVWNDSTLTDVGVVRYRTAVQRISTRTLRLEDTAKLIAEAIAEFENAYDEIFLVGHSQGGILIHWAAQKYLQARPFRSIHSLAGLVTFGSPMAGTNHSFWITRLFFAETRVLSRFNRTVANLEAYFQSSAIESNNFGRVNEGATLLPRYCAVGLYDRVVSSMSAQVSVPSAQRKHFSESHTSLVKPSAPQAEQVVWLAGLMSSICETRRQLARQVQHRKRHEVDHVHQANPIRTLVAEFRGSPTTMECENAFHEAVRDANLGDVTVINRRFADFRDQPHLLVSVIIAQEAINGSTDERDRTTRAYAECVARPSITLGLASFGSRAQDGLATICSWLPSATSNVSYYIDPTPTAQDLYQSTSRWLALVAVALTPKQVTRSDGVFGIGTEDVS